MFIRSGMIKCASWRNTWQALDFPFVSSEMKGEQGKKKRRKGGSLSFVGSKPSKLEATWVRLDLPGSASQRWYGVVPLPLTIGFSALLSSSYRFFLSAKISLQSPLTGDIPSFHGPVFLCLRLSSFVFSPSVSFWRCGVSKYRAWRKIRYRPSSFLCFQALRQISFSLSHPRRTLHRVDIHLSFTKVVAAFTNHLSPTFATILVFGSYHALLFPSLDNL